MKKTLSIFNFKTKLLRFLAVCTTLALVACGVLLLSRATMRKETIIHNEAFLKEKEDYDVIFLGSSHMLNAVFPMQLYNEFGIVSYNMAFHGSGGKKMTSILKLFKEHNDFKIVVFDTFGINNKGYSLPFMHDMYDYFPLSKAKIEALDFLKKDEKIEMLFPFSLYHNKLLTSNFSFLQFINALKPVKGYEKGAEYRPNVQKNHFPLKNPAEYKDLPFDKTKYDEYKSHIVEFVNYCNQNKIIPVLVYLPPYSTLGIVKEVNIISAIAKELNVSFYTLGYENIIDVETDLYNCHVTSEEYALSDLYENSHLNPSGARKVTNYIGKILQKDFNLPDHRNNPKYAHWQKDYHEYRNYVFNKMAGMNELDTLLMACYFEGVSVKLYKKDGVTFDTVEQKLITQLQNNIQILPVQNTDNFDVKIVITDNFTGTQITEKTFYIGSRFKAG